MSNSIFTRAELFELLSASYSPEQIIAGLEQLAQSDPRANASKLLLITTKVKNQRKNRDFAFDYFLSPKTIA